MNDEYSDVFLENQSLKSKFSYLELNLSDVFSPTPDNLERENKVLRDLLKWVRRYMQCADRKQMEKEGYHFPPIEPDISPENDWYRFECWLKGKPIRQTLKEQLPDDLILKAAEQLSDDEIDNVLQKLIIELEKIHFSIELSQELPHRLLYEYLLGSLDEEFDLINDGFWHLDGCSGYCPGCIQRPWCEAGNSSCWQEDEAAGEMYLTESVQRFVSASPMSLKILKKLEAEEEQKLSELKKSQPDFDEDDDIFF